MAVVVNNLVVAETNGCAAAVVNVVAQGRMWCQRLTVANVIAISMRYMTLVMLEDSEGGKV